MLQARSFLLFALLFAAILISSRRAHADTFPLSGDNDVRIIGIGDMDDALLERQVCSPTFSECYYTYLFNGQSVAAPIVTTTPPLLSLAPVEFENQPSCIALPSGFTLVGASACNNGYTILSAEYDNPSLVATLCNSSSLNQAETIFCSDNGSLRGIFDGLDPFNDYVGNGVAVAISLNAEGDFLWDEGVFGEIYLTTNAAPTPEPPSLLLAGAAFALLFSILATRRRLYS